MANIKISGFVVENIHYNENSEILHLFTSNGLVSVMCKGARRYNSHKLSVCIPLTKVECIVTNTKVPNLVDYSIINNYDDIKNDLKKNLWFSFLFNFVNNLPPNSYYSNIYRLLNRILDLDSLYDPSLLVSIFLIKLLKAYGVEPNFKTCVVCNSYNIEFFTVSLGGASCRLHTALDSKPYVDYEMFRELYYLDIYNNNLDNYKYIDSKKLFNMVKSYYEYHVDMNMKMANTLIF